MPRPRSPRTTRARAFTRAVVDALRSIAGLALFGLMGLAWTPFALLLHLLLPQRAARRVGRALTGAGFRAYLRLLQAIGACRFDLAALDALRGQGAMIIAPNHPTLIDAVLIISRMPGLACVMKSSLVAHPALGAGARLAGYIRNDDLRQMIGQALDDLRQGHPLLLFPEATRSSGAPIGAVKGMVGLIARQARVPVQSVLIETDSAFLSKHWVLRRIPRLPITYRVRLGRRFDAPQSAQQLVAELDAYYRVALRDAMLALPPAPDDPHD